MKKNNKKFIFKLTLRIKYFFSKKILRYSFFILIAVSCLHLSGKDKEAEKYFDSNFRKISKSSDLILKDILLDGYHHSPKQDILDSILLTSKEDNKTNKNEPILLINIKKIKKNLESMTWIKHADVERILPSTIRIHILEHKPMAIWQNQGKLLLLSYEGYIIKENNLTQLKDLIIVTGDNAIESSVKLFELLDKNPEIKKMISSVVLIGNRRWDFILYNGIKIKMPEKNLEEALLSLIKKNKQSNLLENNIKIVDLRIADKVFITP